MNSKVNYTQSSSSAKAPYRAGQLLEVDFSAFNAKSSKRSQKKIVRTRYRVLRVLKDKPGLIVLKQLGYEYPSELIFNYKSFRPARKHTLLIKNKKFVNVYPT